MKAIDSIVEKIEALEPIPPVAHQLLELAEDPDSNVSQIAQIIQHDPSLTANVLRMVNSAYFGLTIRIESVQTAISLLGLRQIVDLVLMQAAGQHLNRTLAGYGLQQGELWKQSVASALTARELAKTHQAPRKQLIFTASLLKDLGKVVADSSIAGSMKAITALLQEGSCSFEEAEASILGISHTEVGAMVARKWNFTHDLVYIIRHHHLTDASARSHMETVIVYVADMVSMMVGAGGGVDGLAYRFHNEAMELLGLNEEDLYGIVEAYQHHLKTAQRLMGVV